MEPHSMAKPPFLRLALSTLLAMAATALADQPRPAGGPPAEEAVEFLRLTRDDEDQPRSLDTAIVEYARPDAGRAPVRIDLVAAVHVGSGSYYDTLDRLFADYDAVLYELVAPPNARPKPGGKPNGALGSAQQGLTRMLGLEFQLDSVDYQAANFVHADLSPKEFDAAMRKRGESWWSMFMKLMREGMARAERDGRQPGGDVGIGDMFGILFGSVEGRQVKLRRIMAEQFTDMEALTAAFGGEEGSTLITDRNAAALRVLKDQLGRGRRRIAIFYGAAHMEDFDQRLREDFGLQPRETVWLEAWDLREPAPAAAARR
jgi:hypothetical protein